MIFLAKKKGNNSGIVSRLPQGFPDFIPPFKTPPLKTKLLDLV